jgi:hypothetical protein
VRRCGAIRVLRDKNERGLRRTPIGQAPICFHSHVAHLLLPPV